MQPIKYRNIKTDRRSLTWAFFSMLVVSSLVSGCFYQAPDYSQSKQNALFRSDYSRYSVESEGGSLPVCIDSPTRYHSVMTKWTDCYGTLIISRREKVRHKYVGEWKYGKFHGKGTYMETSGRVLKKGVWEHGRFKHAQKVTPSVTVKKTLPMKRKGSEPSNDKQQSKTKKTLNLSKAKPTPTITLSLDTAKTQCLDLGFKKGTEKFGNCVLKLSK